MPADIMEDRCMKKNKEWWDRKAVAAANLLHDQHFEEHRGAKLCPDLQGGVSVVFGNDGWEDDRTKQQVELLRQYLGAAQIEELGFGVAQEYTWAILCRTQDIDSLRGAVWGAWSASRGDVSGAAAPLLTGFAAIQMSKMTDDLGAGPECN
jgi:hypothetical protein